MIATYRLGVEVKRALQALVLLHFLRLLERPMRRRHLHLFAVQRCLPAVYGLAARVSEPGSGDGASALWVCLRPVTRVLLHLHGAQGCMDRV